MDYRDDLRQAILGETEDEKPRRRWGLSRRDASPKAAPPPVDEPAPVAAPVPSVEPKFQKQAGWAAKTAAGSRSSKAAAERAEKARRGLRAAYSPVSILLRLAFAPVVAASVALSLYISTSPFAPDKALGHLLAMGGCEPAAAVGLAPAPAGSPGYHTPLDRDGNGVSCTPEDLALAGVEMPGAAGEIRSSGAKFIRP